MICGVEQIENCSHRRNGLQIDLFGAREAVRLVPAESVNAEHLFTEDSANRTDTERSNYWQPIDDKTRNLRESTGDFAFVDP